MLSENEKEVRCQDFYIIGENLSGDKQMEEWLGPWEQAYRSQMDRQIAVAEDAFEYGRPESSLGNLVADLIRYRASLEMQTFVHLSVLPHDRIKTTLREGRITRGDLQELFPGSETLVVLEVTGADIEELADEVAAVGGVPLSGLRMTLSDGRATGILLNSGSPEPEETYLVATSSQAVSTRGFTSLEQPIASQEFSLRIRDLLAESLKSRRTVTPFEDQRIRTR